LEGSFLFLFLLSRNLDKRRKLDNKTCLFSEEHESVHHMFFDCVVSRQAWLVVSELVGFQIGSDFDSVVNVGLRGLRDRIEVALIGF
jgi:hypothetical protein